MPDHMWARFSRNRAFGAVSFRCWAVRCLQRLYSDRRTYDRPALTCSAASKLAKAFFPFVNLHEDSVKEMDSYDDRNFYIEGVIEEQNERKSGAFTLKVTNRDESASIPLLEAQNDFMIHLLEGGFPTPRPVRGRDGSYVVVQSIPHPDSPKYDPVYAIRLFTFLQGELLAEVKQDPCLFVEVGKTIGKMSIHLKDFPKHRAIDERQNLWNLGTSLLTCRKYVHIINTESKAQLATEVMDAFEAHALPVLESLPMDYIHGDLNDYNILLGKPDELEQRQRCVSGIIDFGDIALSYRVTDIAIAMAYAAIGKTDGLRAASCHLLSGYQMVHPLSDNELDILYYLISGRLCQSCVMSSFSYSLHPTNDYLLVSAGPGWKTLQEIWSQPKHTVDKMFRQACSGDC